MEEKYTVIRNIILRNIPDLGNFRGQNCKTYPYNGFSEMFLWAKLYPCCAGFEAFILW